jgi:hypothetical protein
MVVSYNYMHISVTITKRSTWKLRAGSQIEKTSNFTSVTFTGLLRTGVDLAFAQPTLQNMKYR